MIIDAHNHPDWHKHDFSAFIGNMDEMGISKTWLLTWECPENEYDPAYNKFIAGGNPGPVPFSQCLKYAERARDRFVLGYAPDPRLPDAIDKLNWAIEVHGVKAYGELKVRMMFDNPDAIRMYRFCGEKGLPVCIHLDYDFPSDRKYPRPSYWYGGSMDAFERAIKACPETVFLGHGPGFWAHISGDDEYKTNAYPQGPVVPGGDISRLLTECPNLYADISAQSGCRALARDKAFGKEFLTQFQDRVVFGRDEFTSIHKDTLESLELSDEVLGKILGGNAVRLIP